MDRYLLHDEDDGKLSKESVRSCIDGSVYAKLENKRNAKLSGTAKAGKNEAKKKFPLSGAGAKQDADISRPLLNGH